MLIVRCVQNVLKIIKLDNVIGGRDFMDVNELRSLTGLIVRASSMNILKEDCFCKKVNVLKQEDGVSLLGVFTDRSAGALLSIFKFYKDDLISVTVQTKHLRDCEQLVKDLEAITLRSVRRYRGTWVDFDTRKYQLRCPVCKRVWRPIRGPDGRMLHREYLCPNCVPRNRGGDVNEE